MKFARMVSSSGKIFINKCDINLKLMLEGGQSFRWKGNKESNEWVGVFNGVVWCLSQFDDHIAFSAHPPHEVKDVISNGPNSKSKKGRATKSNKTVKPKVCNEDVYEKMLVDYLRVESPLEDYYNIWSEKDDNFREAAIKFHGIRMLQQDPVENLFSFICSSNNNISRISMMVERMCELYGEKICSLENRCFYSFPLVESLTSSSVEQALRDAGFGYRAKFISSTAVKLEKLGGAEYLNTLRKLPYSHAKAELLQFPGIGPKVADCICLMSLGHFEAVPVDTHVFQVACQSYLPHLRTVKTVTDRVYKEIGDYFRQLYGPLAGWAHTILFCADLKKFQNNTKTTEKKALKRKLD